MKKIEEVPILRAFTFRNIDNLIQNISENLILHFILLYYVKFSQSPQFLVADQ